MSSQNLIKKEQEFSRYEFHLKFKAAISEEALQKVGAKKLGSVIHEDKYFIQKDKKINNVDELVRIRKEGSEDLMFAYKGPVANRKIRSRLVINRAIKQNEIPDITKGYREVVDVNKKRTIFLSDSVVINIDKVENLGNFVELEVLKEEDWGRANLLIEKLGLNNQEAIKLSYFELSLMNLNYFQRFLVKFHEKFGRFSFGISSAALTTLGIIVGLDSATSSLVAIIGGIISVAVADSLSDSMGMYASKKSERGVCAKTAFTSALSVFWGKFIFTLTFAIPFLIFVPLSAIYVSII